MKDTVSFERSNNKSAFDQDEFDYEKDRYGSNKDEIQRNY